MCWTSCQYMDAEIQTAVKNYASLIGFVSGTCRLRKPWFTSINMVFLSLWSNSGALPVPSVRNIVEGSLSSTPGTGNTKGFLARNFKCRHRICYRVRFQGIRPRSEHVFACFAWSHGCFLDNLCPRGKCVMSMPFFSALDLYQFHMHTCTRFCVFFQLQLLSRVLAHILATLDATLDVLAIALGLYWHGRDMIYRYTDIPSQLERPPSRKLWCSTAVRCEPGSKHSIRTKFRKGQSTHISRSTSRGIATRFLDSAESTVYLGQHTWNFAESAGIWKVVNEQILQYLIFFGFA